jgi:hypothetical protein
MVVYRKTKDLGEYRFKRKIDEEGIKLDGRLVDVVEYRPGNSPHALLSYREIKFTSPGYDMKIYYQDKIVLYGYRPLQDLFSGPSEKKEAIDYIISRVFFHNQEGEIKTELKDGKIIEKVINDFFKFDKNYRDMVFDLDSKTLGSFGDFVSGL